MSLHDPNRKFLVSDAKAALQCIADEERAKRFIPQTWQFDGQDDLYHYFSSLEGGTVSVRRSDGTVMFGKGWPR